MSKPAIVLVTTSFPMANDGSEAAGSFVSDLAEELGKHVPVRVVAPGQQSRRERWVENVEVFRYAAPCQPLSTLKPWHPSDLFEIMQVLRAGMRATRTAAEAGPIAHILALWALPSGIWAHRVAREYGIGYSVWMLGSDVWSLGRIPILRSRLARVICNASNAYADGYKLAEDAQRIAKVPVAFLPSTRCIELADPPPPAMVPPYRLVFIGRWHSNKGVDVLLDALSLLGDDDWRLISEVAIYGGGPLQSLVHAKVQALLDEERPLVVGGFIPKADAERAIARADWVLIPSRIESVPVIFSDAMKLGRPVIAMPVGDLPMLVREGCGNLSDAIDASSFAQVVREALSRSNSYTPAAVRACAERFSLKVIGQKLLANVQECFSHE